MLMDKIPHKYIHLLYELSKVFEGLKKAYIQNDLGAWTTATLQLDDSWKFTIEYEYEDVYLGIDNVQRIAVWEYETFGFLPEDEEDKEAVLNYLKIKSKTKHTWLWKFGFSFHVNELLCLLGFASSCARHRSRFAFFSSVPSLGKLVGNCFSVACCDELYRTSHLLVLYIHSDICF